MRVMSKLTLKEQIKLLDLLYAKLKKDINVACEDYSSNDIYYGLPGHHRMRNDIVKIRREFNELSKMLDPTNNS